MDVWAFRAAVCVFIFIVRRCVVSCVAVRYSVRCSFHHATELVFLFAMKDNSITDLGLAIMKLGDH